MTTTEMLDFWCADCGVRLQVCHDQRFVELWEEIVVAQNFGWQVDVYTDAAPVYRCPRCKRGKKKWEEWE